MRDDVCKSGGPIGRHRLDRALGALLAPDGRVVALRPKTLAVLSALLAARGEVVSREALLAAVWPGVFVSDDSLTQCVAELRRALGEDAGLLRTVPKRGYLLAPGAPPPARPAPDAPQVRPKAPLSRSLALGSAGLVLGALAAIALPWSPAPRPVAASGPAISEADRRRTEADRLVEEGRFLVAGVPHAERNLAARRLFEAALALDPDHAPAHAQLALSYANAVISRRSAAAEADIAQAARHAERALALAPERAVSQIAAGSAARLEGRLAEALAAYRRAAQIDPVAGVSAIALAGWMLTLLGESEAAVPEIWRALATAPSHPLRHNWWSFLGIAQLHAGDAAGAAASLARALDGPAQFPIGERRLLHAAALALSGEPHLAAASLAVLRESEPSLSPAALRTSLPSASEAFHERLEATLRLGLSLAELPQ